METLEIKIKKVSKNDFELPEYQTPYSSGVDIKAAIDETIVLKPGERVLIPTGFSLEIPEGYEAQIRPRSGLALKKGITVLNSPGTIDSDYRGEVKVILINYGEYPVEIHRGDRIAQMVFTKVYRAKFKVENKLSKTLRNEGGFGHSGER